MATTSHRQTTITIDRFGVKIVWKSSGLMTLMHLLTAVSDMVQMETYIRKITKNPHTKQPAAPNCQLPVTRVTPTNTPLVKKLRMSLIAKAMMYTGVSFRRNGFRIKATHTMIFPKKPAAARTVQERDSRTTRSILRGGSSNEYITLLK